MKRAEDPRAHLTPEQRRRRRLFERLWIVAGVGYAVARIWVAHKTVGDHGVDMRLFAILEIGLAWPHSLSSARVVEAFIDRDSRRGMFWAVIFAITHIAPELQVALQGDDLPLYVWVMLGVIIFGLGGVSVYGLVKQIRQGRLHLPHPRLPHPHLPHQQEATASPQALETTPSVEGDQRSERSVAIPAKPKK